MRVSLIHRALGIAGAGLAVYGILSAVVWQSSIWYSFFVIGSFLFFDLTDCSLNGDSNLRRLLERDWHAPAMTYGLFLLVATVVDSVLGRYVADMWIYPHFTKLDEVIHVILIGYPFAFFSVSACYRSLRGVMLRFARLRNPMKPTKTQVTNGAAAFLLVLFAVGVAAPLIFYGLNTEHIHQVMVVSCALCAFSVAPLTYFICRYSFLLYFLSCQPATVIAALLTIAISGPLHEVPNTFAWEWVYQNMPFTEYHLLKVHILVYTIGWTFLCLFGIGGNDLFFQLYPRRSTQDICNDDQ